MGIKDNDKGGPTAVREPKPPKVLGPQSEPKGPNGQLVDKSVFASADPANTIEGIIKSPEDACVGEEYSKICELREISETNTELRAGLSQILHDIASRNDVEYGPTVVKLLMKHWTEKKNGGQVPYDEHMKEHVDAIRCLFTAWAKDRYNWNGKLRILDASCGTGTVLQAFLDSVPKWMHSRIKVTANDISDDAIKAAKQNLRKYEKRITYDNVDITEKLPGGKYNVVILSQTLPFITDDNAIKQKRLGKTIRQDEDNHIEAKKQLITRLLGKLKDEDSELLIVDEDPMQYSDKGETPNEIIYEILFSEVARFIDKDRLINVMKDIEEARYVGHMETMIDGNHDMFIKAYSRIFKRDKKPKMDERPSVLPLQNGLRNLEPAELEIVRHMENIHPYLAERLRGFDGNTEAFRPITGTRLVIDRKKYDEEICNAPYYWKKNGTNDVVIVAGLVHELGKDGYKNLIKNLKQSGKVKPGSLLLFIDQFPPPSELGPEREPPPYRIGNGDARLQIFKSPDHTFLASYRSGNKYGYLYVIRELTSPPQTTED